MRRKEIDRVPEQANASAEVSYAALVAIDWADQKHVWSLQAVGSKKRETGELQQVRAVTYFSCSANHECQPAQSPLSVRSQR